MEDIILALKRLFMNDILPLRKAGSEEVGRDFGTVQVLWDGTKFKPYSSSINVFSARLFRQWLSAQEGSGIISGTGLYILLAIIFAAAGNRLRSEIEKITDTGLLLRSSLLRELMEALEGSDRWAKFRLKNAFWYHKGVVLNPDFRKILTEDFKSMGGPTNFSAERAQRTVNNWAKENSAGHIPELLELLRGNMIFAQMIKTKGVWLSPFERMGSRTDLFFPEKGKPVAIEMMRTSGIFRRIKGAEWEAVYLPFGTELFTCILVLPAKGKILKEITEIYEPRIWQREELFFSEEISVTIPIFSLSRVMELGDFLKKMGLQTGFDPEAADFSRMSGEPVWLDQIIQGVHFEVGETGIGDNRFAKTKHQYRSHNPDLPEIIFDRPFYIVVIENQTGLMLLQGIFEGEKSD
ncbi:MAG: serpin family protein [Bacteroidia bacterium]|nr:serpin family protein [Bacteroidia bacterium]